MARRKRDSKDDRRRRQEQRAKQHHDELMKATAEIFTCATSITRDFADHCHNRLEDLEADIVYNHFAVELWHRHSEIEDLPAVLADLLAERQRHFAALTDLRTRLSAIEARDEHVHLDPALATPAYLEKRIYQDPPPLRPTDSTRS